MDMLIRSAAVIAPITAIAVFALPSYLGIIWQKGFFKGIFILLVLTFYSLFVYGFIERTGFPTGNFEYSSILGYRLLGIVPWVLLFVYPSILLAGYWLGSKFSNPVLKVILGALAATLVFLVLEPAAVKLEFWQWGNPGAYFNVHVSMLLGWFVFNVVGVSMTNALWGHKQTVRGSLVFSGFIILLFWTGVNIGVGQALPATIGGALAVLFLIFLSSEKSRTQKHMREASKPY